MGILGGLFGKFTDFLGCNIVRDFGRRCDQVVDRARQQANEVLHQAVREANKLIDRAKQEATEWIQNGIDHAAKQLDEVFDRAIKNFILGQLFLVLFLVGAYFGANFAYHYFFVDVDMEPEKISFEFTAVDHAYFAMKQYIVFAYDQILCASTLLGALFGIIFPCLLLGLHVFNGNNNNVLQADSQGANVPRRRRRPNRPMAPRPRPPWRW